MVSTGNSGKPDDYGRDTQVGEALSQKLSVLTEASAVALSHPDSQAEQGCGSFKLWLIFRSQGESSSLRAICPRGP